MMRQECRDIDMICVFYKNGPPIPLKFRLNRNDGSTTVVHVDQVRTIEEKQPGGLHSYIYTCASDQGEYVVEYTLTYKVRDLRWQFLWNIQ